MNFVNIDETNIQEFKSVLPETIIDGLGISIGAVDENLVCGAISVSFNGEEYSIDWLYVTPAKRLQGVGRSLVREVRAMVSNIGLCPIRMVINASDGSGLYLFALSLEEDTVPIDISYSHDRYVISAGELFNSEDVKKIRRQAENTSFETKLLWNMTKKEIEEAFSVISTGFSIYDEEKFMEFCEQKLCIVKKRKGTIQAFSLMQRESEDVLKLAYIYSTNPKAIIELLKDIFCELEKYSKPQKIYFEPITEQSNLLAKRLFPNAIRENIYEFEL